MSTGKSVSGKGFPATHWTQVYEASDHKREAGSQALAGLLTTYRPALGAFLQSRYPSAPADDIEDWLSSFIEHKILERNLLRDARKDKGRFRNYLLTALDRFVIEQNRHSGRQRRRPDGGLVPYEDGHNEIAGETAQGNHTAGDRAWALEVIERARQQTEAFYLKKGSDVTWAVFWEGCYHPLYLGGVRPSDGELAQRHDLKSAREVSNILTNVKRRFGNYLRKVVGEYVLSDEQVDAEIRELMAIVSDGG